MGDYKLPEREDNLTHPVGHLIQESGRLLQKNPNDPIGQSLYRMVRQKLTEPKGLEQSDTITLPYRDGYRRFVPYLWEQWWCIGDVATSVTIYLFEADLSAFRETAEGSMNLDEPYTSINQYTLVVTFEDGVPVLTLADDDGYHEEGFSLPTARDARAVTSLCKRVKFNGEKGWLHDNSNGEWHPKMTEWVEALRWEWLTDDV